MSDEFNTNDDQFDPDAVVPEEEEDADEVAAPLGEEGALLEDDMTVPMSEIEEEEDEMDVEEPFDDITND